MYRAVIAATKEKMIKTKEFYQKDMLSLRAGRANPQILDKIMVDYYGSATPLKQMGNINRKNPVGDTRADISFGGDFLSTVFIQAPARNRAYCGSQIAALKETGKTDCEKAGF